MARSVGSLLLTVTALAALLSCLPAARARAATLHGGDVVILAREGTVTPGVLLHLDVAAQSFQTIVPQPALGRPRDLAVRADGTILVADAALGLVAVAPGTGAASVIAGPGAFGGSGPTTLAFATNGDLLLAGPTGVARLSAGQSVPTPVCGAGLLVDPTGIIDDGAGGMLVDDDNNSLLEGGGIVHVSSGGSQAAFSAGCTPSGTITTFPVLPLQIRRGQDGFLYVVSGPYSGPTNYLNAGLFRMNPSTGVATVYYPTKFIRGFDFAADGIWMDSCIDVSRGCGGNVLSGPAGQFYPAGLGPLAVVPGLVTPTRPRSWGSLKSIYR